ncbi:Cupredoxin [Acephala macrosclerotiorum]|nr:Cupredoxin [Acephala macrosclerotiorum]
MQLSILLFAALQWPCPAIVVNAGDTIKINVANMLGSETTAIHFHGLFQQDTNNMDGPAMFKLNQTGTFWYHAHIGGQYIDGLRGPFIIHDFYAPYKYDTEYVLTLSDLYHKEAPQLINYYQSTDNYNTYGGTEPVPDSFLINEVRNASFNMTAGKTYLFHIISTSAFAPFWLQFDQHQMTVVEIDGVYTVPYPTNQVYVAPAQRYTVLITAQTGATSSFAIVTQANVAMFDTNKSLQDGSYVSTVSATLVYNNAFGPANRFTIVPEPFDDSLMVPLDVTPIMSLTFMLSTLNINFSQALFRCGFRDQTTPVPTMYTALTTPAADVNYPTIYGTGVNPQVIPFGSVVEISIDNHDDRAHPFHLHGHNFPVVARYGNGPDFPDSPYYPSIPMRRDVILVHPQGGATIRYVADSPGVNLFHCHVEWHVEAGMTATLIEAPDHLQQMKIYTPNSHKDGNAGGNSKNWYDLSNPPANAWG